MFNRFENYFIITTNNLSALEAITVWIYQRLQIRYFIQIEVFPNLTVYRVYISIEEDWDDKIINELGESLALQNIKIMEEL